LTNEVIESVMEGYHGTIFAYGQTGSGKTYTMVGDRAQEVPGVMSLGTKQMFEWIKADDYRDYMVRVSYMEVYMERVRDLLNPEAIGEELKVRQDTGGKGFFVECREVVVTNEDQIYAMLDAVRMPEKLFRGGQLLRPPRLPHVALCVVFTLCAGQRAAHSRSD